MLKKLGIEPGKEFDIIKIDPAIARGLQRAVKEAPIKLAEGATKMKNVSDVWSLCSRVLPDVGRVKACIQDKMGQLSKGCIDKVLDKTAGQSFKVCKNQT